MQSFWNTDDPCSKQSNYNSKIIPTKPFTRITMNDAKKPCDHKLHHRLIDAAQETDAKTQQHRESDPFTELQVQCVNIHT